MTIKKNKNATNKEKTVSVADILMVIGFVVLAFTTYLGSKLLTGDIGQAIITNIVVLGIAGLLLWVLCTAKKAQNHRQAWMIVEGISLIVFVVLFCVATSETRHFLYVSENKAQLKQNAEADREKVMALFDDYQKSESQDISAIYNAIKALPADQTLHFDNDTRKRLEEWVGDKSIKSGRSYSRAYINNAALDYQKVMNAILVGKSFNELKNKYKEHLDKIVKSLGDGSSYGDYYDMATKLPVHYSKIADELCMLSSRPQKYVLDGVHSNIITSRSLAKTYEAETDALELPKFFNGKKESTAAGWCLTLGMLLFILCAYFATPRSRRVTVLSNGILNRKKNYTNDGGIDLC